MIDLSVLKDRWTVDGAREIFAQLVTQCVRANYPAARAIRPDPGDEGVDTFVGEFDKDVRIWQAKYFCDGVGASQQKQIRESWKACRSSSFKDRVTMWTLCVPGDLSMEEEKWWQGWKLRESKKAGIPIELWTKPHFSTFSTRKGLDTVFAFALQRGCEFSNVQEVITAMTRAFPRTLERPPAEYDKVLRTAVFVRKLEAAGITAHRGVRSAFYNYELLRSALEQGGATDEVLALNDLQERILDLWEEQYNAHFPERLGRVLFSAVEAEMKHENEKRLASPLNLHLLHKKGGLHAWADVCEAGWTANHKSMGAEDPDTEESGA
jgi:hypothetical protein